MTHYLKKAAAQSRKDNRDLIDTVRNMIAEIERDRDDAIRRYARQLDGWDSSEFRVSEDEIAAARRAMSETFKDDFAFCKKQVTDFAKRQRDSIAEFEEDFGNGITLGQKVIPIETVGCYIPGG